MQCMIVLIPCTLNSGYQWDLAGMRRGSVKWEGRGAAGGVSGNGSGNGNGGRVQNTRGSPRAITGA
jgi:hypothetical protein